MVLEVELADDDRQRVLICLEPLEERVDGLDARSRHALQVADAGERLDHPRGQAPAAVAVAEGQQAQARALVVEKAADAAA